MEELLRRKARTDLETWCRIALAPLGHEPAAHHRLLITELEAVARGTNDRLIVMMPPGSAKSTYTSVLFPPWFLAQADEQKIIAASNTAELAEKFSRDAMRLIRAHPRTLHYALARESAVMWDTSNGGAYRSAGVGGTITGARADLALIDDPIRGREDADSERIRNKTWDWFRADLLTRLKPGGRIVLILTHWHDDDIAGRLLATEADRWRVIRLPALAEFNDPLGRSPGQPLWPEWEGAKALADKRRTLGEREWSALFQQRPVSDEGAIIKREWWMPWTDAPPLEPDFTIVSIDPAYTEKDSNDPTGCTIWHVTSDPKAFRSQILLRYAWAKRLEFPDLITEITETIEHFSKPWIPLKVLIEVKASGLSVVQELRRRMPKLTIQAINPKMDKIARAHATTAIFEGGHVYAMAKIENGKPVFRPASDIVISECEKFPVGTHDDLVDSATMALSFIRNSGIELFSEDEPEPSTHGEQEALY
jgi:predicted phage terminase large subunit-like protein